MKENMRAVVYREKGVFALEERPVPQIQDPTDAVVRVTLASICSSDLHIKGGFVPRAVPGTIVGHEFVGVVESVGAQVASVQPGDRVAVNVETFCGSCFFCQRGFVNNCTDPSGGWALGCRIDGGQAEYVRVPYADNGLTKIPDSVTDRQALFTGDILSTGYWAAQISRIQPGDTVLVLGAGGAAKAVCLKLAQAGAEVVVCNRTADKAAALCAHEPARLRPAGFDPDTLRRKAAECGLLVNCTSLGMEGAAGQFEEFSFLDALPARAPVVDLIYAPAETELLRRAREGGHQTANGFGLLVNQAVLSLEHFTGTAIDAAEMKRTCCCRKARPGDPVDRGRRGVVCCAAVKNAV